MSSTSRSYIDTGGARPRLVVVLRHLHRLAAQGLVRRRGDRGERLRLRRRSRASAATTRTSRRRCGCSTAGVEGFFVMGQNPAVGSQHAGLQRRALAKLKWLVVRDLAEIETATFWRDSPEVQSGELRPEEIQTEVFLMPAAVARREGGHASPTPSAWSSSATRRSSRPATRARSCGSCTTWPSGSRRTTPARPRPRDWPIVNLHWDYPELGDAARARRRGRDQGDQRVRGRDRAARVRVHRAAQRRLHGLRLLDLLGHLRRRRQPGPSPEPRRHQQAGRRSSHRSGRGRGRRTGASSTTGPPPIPQGRPWSERKKYVWWDPTEGRWTGLRRPRLSRRPRRPTTARRPMPTGMDAISGDDPFIMMADGRGWLYSPSGLLDGPLPTHYEPLESPVHNLLYPDLGADPSAIRWRRPENPYHATGDPALPGGRHDLPADRASHRRRHEPDAPMARRSYSRRCSPRSTRSSPPSEGSRTAAG